VIIGIGQTPIRFSRLNHLSKMRSLRSGVASDTAATPVAVSTVLRSAQGMTFRCSASELLAISQQAPSSAYPDARQSPMKQENATANSVNSKPRISWPSM